MTRSTTHSERRKRIGDEVSREEAGGQGVSGQGVGSRGGPKEQERGTPHPFDDPVLRERLLQAQTDRLNVKEQKEAIRRELTWLLAAGMLAIGGLIGFALTAMGADVASVYLGERAPALRVFLHNTVLAFVLVFPVLLYGLRSRRVQRYLDRLVRRRAQAEQNGARAYLRRVEGASGFFWQFEPVLPELDLDEGGEEAFKKLVEASRRRDVGAMDIGRYRAYVETLRDRCQGRAGL